jgi:hypothetical protein
LIQCFDKNIFGTISPFSPLLKEILERVSEKRRVEKRREIEKTFFITVSFLIKIIRLIFSLNFHFLISKSSLNLNLKYN